MSFVDPVGEDFDCEKTQQTFERIREVFEIQEIPLIYRYLAVVPALLQDFFMNFRKYVAGNGKLDPRTRLLIATAVAGNSGVLMLVQYLETLSAARGVTRTQMTEAIAVASANSMYNSLFKFRDLSGSGVFDGMGVGLRAHTFTGTSLDAQTVELINISLSNINGCKPCTSGHVLKAQELKVSDEAIYEAIQCASTIVSGAQFLRSIGVA